MTQHTIDIQGGRIGYDENPTLSQINLHVEQGDLVYLVGKTGSGKSTLLKALYAELPIQAEQAIVAGYDLLNLQKNDIAYLRRKLGIVFQDFQLLPDRTVLENLLFVLKATGWQSKKLKLHRIDEVLQLVNLDARKHAIPHQLSGGEQQKVALARALLNDPLLILADEPTGNLDPALSQEIMKLLAYIAEQGTAIVMATHNYDLVLQDRPVRILQVEDGHCAFLPAKAS